MGEQTCPLLRLRKGGHSVFIGFTQNQNYFLIIDKEGEAIKNCRAFISYSHKDTKLVEKIAKVLKENWLVSIRVKDCVSGASQLQLLIEPDVPKLVFP